MGGGQVSYLSWDDYPGMSDFYMACFAELTLSGCHSLLRLIEQNNRDWVTYEHQAFLSHCLETMKS